MKEVKKAYKTDEITVYWEASKCKHAGVCVRSLPKVYNPKARPWINIENATTSELVEQIDNCPSGALSYEVHSSDD